MKTPDALLCVFNAFYYHHLSTADDNIIISDSGLSEVKSTCQTIALPFEAYKLDIYALEGLINHHT